MSCEQAFWQKTPPFTRRRFSYPAHSDIETNRRYHDVSPELVWFRASTGLLRGRADPVDVSRRRHQKHGRRSIRRMNATSAVAARRSCSSSHLPAISASPIKHQSAHPRRARSPVIIITSNNLVRPDRRDQNQDREHILETKTDAKPLIPTPRLTCWSPGSQDSNISG